MTYLEAAVRSVPSQPLEKPVDDARRHAALLVTTPDFGQLVDDIGPLTGHPNGRYDFMPPPFEPGLE